MQSFPRYVKGKEQHTDHATICVKLAIIYRTGKEALRVCRCLRISMPGPPLGSWLSLGLALGDWRTSFLLARLLFTSLYYLFQTSACTPNVGIRTDVHFFRVGCDKGGPRPRSFSEASLVHGSADQTTKIHPPVETPAGSKSPPHMARNTQPGMVTIRDACGR